VRTSQPRPDHVEAAAPSPDGNAAVAGGSRRIVLGIVLGAFGIQGWVRIKPLGSDTTSLLTLKDWILALPRESRPGRVEEAKQHGASVLAKIAGFDDRDQAEAWRGAEVSVSRDQLPDADPGEYYWSDLIGLSVRNIEGVELGSVAGLIEAPAHDVLRVASEGGREQLIPFVEPIVRSVELESRAITVDWQKDY
jgi:16S rRNA processing protein RimM